MRFHTAAIATAVTAIATTGIVNANQAEAQNNTLELVRALNGGIATMDCNSVGTLLRGAKLVDDDTTTRSQLTSKLNKQFGADASLTLIAAPTINAVGDRALVCGVVKADPATPQNQAIEFASKLSSQTGLPELRNALPAVAPNGSSF
ncbi:hypothetical protein [Corynebacterium appendicis]|uniref:hypothetical protein n=1 Tax=Corynebacterium appendicis TaxID=163202 RepID=UPI00235205B9|nr:hypothetical protein [Corynebacterium appendicis]